MEYKSRGKELLIRLDDGEEIIESIKSICKKEKIDSAFVSAIGAAKTAEISHYNTKDKKYNTKKFEGMLEIISINGNIGMNEGELVLHLHIAISMHDFTTISGHLMSAHVYPTCEILVLPYSVKIKRKHDEKTGLNLQQYE